MSSIAQGGRSAALQYFFWRHPEWWALGLCGSAWAVLLLRGFPGSAHVQHRMTLAHELSSWMAMVVAMMVPMVIFPVRVTAASSLWGRRHRAITSFLAGYLGPWLALGLLVAGLREATWTHTDAAAASSFAAAALWQLTSMHRRAVIACCRRLPLAPTGWHADRDCLRYGGAIGVSCIWSCWPLMLACALSGHGLVAMIGGTIVGVVERRWFRPPTRYSFWGTLGLAAYYGVLSRIG